MQRVMIIGAPGSGKSTLARTIGTRTDLPVYHTDMMTSAENWVERSNTARREMAGAVDASEAWVFGEGASGTYENRLSRADTLILLDLPVRLRLWHVAKRIFQNKGQARADLPKGCTETVDLERLKFYHYIWKTRKIQRDRIARLIADHQGAALAVHLQSPKAIARHLSQIPPA